MRRLNVKRMPQRKCRRRPTSNETNCRLPLARALLSAVQQHRRPAAAAAVWDVFQLFILKVAPRWQKWRRKGPIIIIVELLWSKLMTPPPQLFRRRKPRRRQDTTTRSVTQINQLINNEAVLDWIAPVRSVVYWTVETTHFCLTVCFCFRKTKYLFIPIFFLLLHAFHTVPFCRVVSCSCRGLKVGTAVKMSLWIVGFGPGPIVFFLAVQ